MQLREDADWMGASEALIAGCAGLRSEDERVRWLEQLCVSLGDQLYPAFLKVLCLIGEHGDAKAQGVVAETLVAALQSGRIPSGRYSMWGTSHGASRSVGPVEYLCAWYAQPNELGALPVLAFDRAAKSLLGLIGHSKQAQQLYCAKLRADAEDPLGGTWSRSSRQALLKLVTVWEEQRNAVSAVDAFVAGMSEVDTPRPMSNWGAPQWLP